MSNSSFVLDAAIRAIQGEPHLHAVLPAFAKRRLALVLAFAPNADRTVRDLAALYGDAPYMLEGRTDFDPCFHAELRRLIGTKKGEDVIAAWAKVAPVGWGRPSSADLVNAVNQATLAWGPAAALIGPCDETAAFLHNAGSLAFAVRRWGQHDPDDPTWWTTQISENEQDRFFRELIRYPYLLGTCLPWLPPDRACQTPIDDHVIDAALSAFAEASPTARALHAALVRRLVAQANPNHLGAITRLACALASDEVWARVVTLVKESPDAASSVVAAAPWESLDATVHAAILECVNRSDICAAVAAAQGRTVARRITRDSAIAFFAALAPKVWDRCEPDVQRQWRDSLPDIATHLAVRSLGPRPEFLAQAKLDDITIRAVQRHACDENAMRDALFPVAIREADMTDAHKVVVALPTMPSDPGAFFVIAGGRADPSALTAARTTLLTPADLSLACIMQRCAGRNALIGECSTALQYALRRRTWEDLEPITALLDDNARAILMPDPDALVERVAHPDHREALRQALERLESLPPEVVIPTYVALTQARSWTTLDTAGAIADVLHAHGDVFLALTEAIENDRLRAALLPQPKKAALADALRAVVRADVPNGRRLAIALHVGDWSAMLYALLTLHPPHAIAVWKAMAKTEQHAIASALSATLPIIDALAERDPIAALALGAVQADNADIREAAIAALAARSDALRAIWFMLPREMQQFLRSHPALSDLTETTDQPSARRFRRR